MFGVRRSNVSYKRKTDARESNISTTNIGNFEVIGEDEEENIYKNAKFIFYDDQNKFTNQLEIYISLTNFNNKKHLVIISSDSTIEELNNQVVQSLGSLPEFKNINGIRIEDIHKISNDNKISLPEVGKVSDFVNSGDILYCNLITDEYWIKTYYNLQSINFKKIIKLEYRLKKKMKYKKFKLMLMKGGIQLFIESIKNNKLYKHFNYYVKLFEFKIKKHKKVITHHIHNDKKDKKSIDKIINFSSEIIVILKFGLFEKLIHQNIKLTNFNSKNNLRVNEYNDLSFMELYNDKKFLPEYTAIREISEEFLNTQYNNNNPNFLFFTKKKKNKKKMSFNEYGYDSKKRLLYNDGKNSINELKEEEDRKTIKNDKDDIDILGNLNIDDLNKEANETLNTIKNSDIESHHSLAKTENIILKEDENNKILNKKKSKSLFHKNNISNDLDNKAEKPKKEIIKNMIILAQFLNKEEKKEKKFMRKISCQDFDNNFEFQKNKPKAKQRISASNKNLNIYDNKNNINFLMEEDDEEINRSNEFQLQLYNDNDRENEMDTEIEIETKPRTFSNKNLLKNNLLFKTFNDSRDNSGNILTELFLESPEENNDLINLNLYNDDNRLTRNNINSLNPGNKNQNYSEPNYEDYASDSNLDEENVHELNALPTSPKSKKDIIFKKSTFSQEQKKSLFSHLRINQSANLYKEIKSIFDYDHFLVEIQKYFNNSSDKKTLDKIKMPQSKDMEYLEKEYKFLIEKKKVINNENLRIGVGSGEYHIYIFMSALLLFCALILICLNIDDLMSVFS